MTSTIDRPLGDQSDSRPEFRRTSKKISKGSSDGHGRGIKAGALGAAGALLFTGGIMYNQMDNDENHRVHGDENRVVESLKHGGNVGVLNRIITVNSGATIRFTVGAVDTEEGAIMSYDNVDSKVPGGSRLVIKNPIVASDSNGDTWYGFTAADTSANGDVANSLKWVSADLQHQVHDKKSYMDIYTPKDQKGSEDGEAVLQGDHLVDSQDGSPVAESMMISDKAFEFMGDLALKQVS